MPSELVIFPGEVQKTKTKGKPVNMKLFENTRNKITEPARNVAAIAVTALIVAFIALIVAVKR